MVFSTHIFLFYFLPLALAAYYATPAAARTRILIVLSYVFYGWGNPLWIALMAASTVVDYYAAVWIVRLSGLPAGSQLPEDGVRTRGQKAVLIGAIASNLAFLGFFKYYDFAVGNINAAVAALAGGSGPLLPLLYIALPAGISFYTFESMSYTIDVYRGRTRPADGLADYACFVSLFPHLVAGPIVRYLDLGEQIRSRRHTLDKFARGVALFSLGLGKKILLANPMGAVADFAFDAGAISVVDAWYGLIAYAFQIYFDFSAYSDMAFGLGLMFGFVLVRNFDDPYSATSLTDFWRRWHMSLSGFLRDYLYIPLGGNRRGPARTYVNLMTVMLLGGLWHGASWNFVIWGGLHGAGLAVERFAADRGLSLPLPAAVRTVLVFVFVCLAWVFFRADSLPAAVQYLAALIGVGVGGAQSDVLSVLLRTPYHLGTLGLCAIACWMLPQAWKFSEATTPLRAGAALAVLLLSIVLMWTQTENPFLYYRF
jgi:alginate O-acetyltransferase complex protein AlgI